MANFHMTPLGVDDMFQYWYQYVCLVVLCFSVLAGLSFIAWNLVKLFRKWMEKRRLTVPPADTKDFVQDLARRTKKFQAEKKVAGKPKSFGVYYGEFSNPISADQQRLLQQYDAIILDPLKSGVKQALSSVEFPPKYVIGRVDVGALTTGLPESDRVPKVKIILETVLNSMSPTAENSVYNGVLLANWDSSITPGICNEIINFLVGLNLNVYNEICAPRFMDKINSTVKIELLSGVIFMNAAILPNGERRDYFNMICMKPALEIVMAQSCLRDSFAVLMCELVEDDSFPTNAVIKRTFKWCSFYGAVPWIGTRAALTDASKNAPIKKPDGAFEWLKQENVMEIHETWRLNSKIITEPCAEMATYERLESIIPGITESLHLNAMNYSGSSAEPVVQTRHFDWVDRVMFRTVDPLSTSSHGRDYSGLGCFPIGMSAHPSDFNTLVQSQSRLLKLNLLQKLESQKLDKVAHDIQQLVNYLDNIKRISSISYRCPLTAADIAIIKELAQSLNRDEYDEKKESIVEVYIGLDTGFRTHDGRSQFWGLHDGDEDATRIYISRNSNDITGTILHTFMSSRRCPRMSCFEAEFALAQALNLLDDLAPLSPRMLQDLAALTPTEKLILVQNLAIANNSSFLLKLIRDRCEYHLIDVSSAAQLKSLNTIAYLRGEITIEELVTKRIQWYRQNKIAELPHVEHAIALFKQVDHIIDTLLRGVVKEGVAAITSVLEEIIVPGKIDVRADLLAMAIFCSFRRYTYDEIYLDATDRCPLLNDQPDQAAVFAELWGLGSHCEAYLDVTPKALGKIFYDRYRAYYEKHPPPLEADDPVDFLTAYASAKTDIDREGITDLNKGIGNSIRNTSYLGVFAVPALIDILLLTTIGRGLYLSAFMTTVEQHMSTYALVIALVLCGAVCSAIGCGGSYYLYAMVYPTMNTFMLTRFIGGMVFTSVMAVIALIIVGVIKGFYAGAIFLLYLMVLSIYLYMLAVMANLQFPGSPLPSGRTAMAQCLCILLISPILTQYVGGHDIIVYLSVLWGFACVLIYRSRQVIARWNQWLQNVPSNSDQEVLDWYVKAHCGGDGSQIAQMPAPAAMELARSTLYKAVLKERSKSVFVRKTSDDNVRKLAAAYPTTLFLLDWYSRYMQASKPLPYTSTWNLQVKVALNTLRNFDRGLKLHNGMIHWRHASTEIACGMLYFFLALLDRWIELFCGGTLIGLQILTDSQSRVAVGLGLVYYLFGAVVLDVKASPLYEAVKKVSSVRLHSAEHLAAVAKQDAHNKKRLYWGTLMEFQFIQIWGLVFATGYIWSYVNGEKAMILFFSYVFAYSGLLWFQYNRVFAGSKATKPLAFALVLGLSVGLPLRICLPSIFWNDVLALTIATWTAAILTFIRADIGAPPLRHLEDLPHLDQNMGFSHSQKAIGNSPQNLDKLFDELENASHYVLDRTMTAEIKQILLRSKNSARSLELKAAFPNAFALLDRIIVMWDTQETVVTGVPLDRLVGPDYDVRAISRKVGDKLKIFVGVEYEGREWSPDAQLIAEAIVHETCETEFGFSHSDAVLAELLVSSREHVNLPSRIQHQLENCSNEELAEILHRRDRELVRHLCLGLETDRYWESLPNDVRRMLLRRVESQSCEINAGQLEWIKSLSARVPVDTFLARRDLHVWLTLLIDDYVALLLRAQRSVPERRKTLNYVQRIEDSVAPLPRRRGIFAYLPFNYIARTLRGFIKFLFLAFIAEPDFQRELAYALRRMWIRPVVMFIATSAWFYAKFVQDIVLPFYLFYRRPDVQKLRNYMRNGTITTMKHDRLIINDLKTTTGFIQILADGVQLAHYSGNHAVRPDDSELLAINYYSSDLRLQKRQEYRAGSKVNQFIYQSTGRIPTRRECVEGELTGEVVYYSPEGFITHGSGSRNGIQCDFNYTYRKNCRFDDSLLRANYSFPVPTWTAEVQWCVPPTRKPEKMHRWIPYSNVTRATFTSEQVVYDTKWVYDHKCHPTLSTLMNGEESKTPDLILNDQLGIFRKPSTSFAVEDPLLPFKNLRSNCLTRLFRLNKKSTPISTSRARTYLWQLWKSSTLDGVTARWLDEMALRSEKTLKPYWRARDAGKVHAAIKYLRKHGDAIMASVDIDHSVSAWTALAFKMSDLFSLGQGGDAPINTRTTAGQINDTHERLHVLATDTGTWPCEGGGVSCCRRDMVDNLENIKWHIVAETANDYSLPRFQIEQNVQSLKILPLWGLDFLTSIHGIIENELDTAMEAKLIDTTDRDIAEKFLPILTSLVRGARSIEYNSTNVKEYTDMLVKLNTYFEKRNWKAVWSSEIVKAKWQELWLSNSIENTRPISKWFDIEKPTLLHLDEALELYSRCISLYVRTDVDLFILSIPVPEHIPTVFQATHHSIGATYGIVCKLKRRCTFQVWDHSIIWRECNTYLSSAQCNQAPFTRIALIGLMRLAAHLNMYNADVILPCTNFFNPGWEVELGSCEGVLQHRKIFSRKIDPIINGICNMDSFDPIDKLKTEKPTVTMLSHVQYVKDVKNALLAADIIVNEWGFKEYRLDLYGGLDRTPSYTVECQEIIASKSLRGYVTLKGYGNPKKVLQDTWVFMNSSISEGLPLAIGEAALTGAPIVCTDVGATFQVLTDPDDPKRRYGSVIAPNDPRALARAQISLLAVMDEWVEYGEDDVPPEPSPENFTPADVERITKRMYEKTPQRRKLGLQLRKVVQKSFSGDRYLREHEQMLWIGKYQTEARRSEAVKEHHEAFIEFLDEELEQFRPHILRDVSGYSAFNSTVATSVASTSHPGSATPDQMSERSVEKERHSRGSLD